MKTRQKIKVKDSPSLERDTFSSAILNYDSGAYAAAVRRKKNRRSTELLIQELTEKIQELMQWKEEITALLSKKADK